MSNLALHLADFSNPEFDAKQWINTVLKPKHDDMQSKDDDDTKNTTLLVTRLQLESESTSQAFDQLSTQVIKSMPRILYELKTISDNAKATQIHIEKVKKELHLIEGNTDIALEKLRRPHIAKTRMEECRSILLEKFNHIEKLRQEQDRIKQQEEEKKAAAEAAEAAEAKALAEKEKKRQLEVEEQRLREQEEEEEKKRKEEEEEKKKKEEEKDMLPEMDEALEYGHVQLPPLRQPAARQQTFQQIQNQVPEQNDGYLQHISGSVSPQVSNVFKRIGVPLDKFWQ